MKEKIIEIVGFNMEPERAELIARQVLDLFAVSVSLLERAASLVGNHGTNISWSTDMACDEWQKDYERWRNER